MAGRWGIYSLCVFLAAPLVAVADEPATSPAEAQPVPAEAQPVPAEAQPVPAEAQPVPAGVGAQLPSRSGISVGTPWQGALLRGRLLRESAHVRYLPRHADSGHFWGIDALVELLQRSAGAVQARWPGSRMTVGELSSRYGGDLRGHRSHRSGRDADIAFYVRRDDGGFGRLAQFVGFGRRAPLSSDATVRFDDARNWALVESLLSDGATRVQYLFASNPIRARLLSFGRRRGASDELLQTVAAVMVEPTRAEAHDDHFHLRIYCPTDQRDRCQDAEPYWPWFEGAPPVAHAALPAIRWRPTGEERSAK